MIQSVSRIKRPRFRRSSPMGCFLGPVLVVVLLLRVDPLFSWTISSSSRRQPPMGQQRCIGSSPNSRIKDYDTHRQFSQSMRSRRSSSCMAARRRNSRDFYDDDEEEDYYRDKNTFEEEEQLGDTDYDDDYYSSSSSSYYDDDEEEVPKPTNGRGSEEEYYNDELTRRRSNTEERRGGYYQVSFNNEEVDPSETEIDWEICYNDDETDKSTPQALVLLPPAAVDRPKAIVHFVGGTVFGSNPKLWYSGLLEAIVRNTSVAIVVTPIPVTLFQNPLEHVRLAKSLQRSFRLAWTKVLEDEYGPTTLQGIPVCGMGHSLGARLLAVMTTLDKNEAYPIRSSSRRRSDPDDETPKRVIPPYKSLCLISFTNYGAKVGIPGVGALLKQSKKREAYNKQPNGASTTRRSRSPPKPNRRKYDYYAASGYDQYDDYEDDYENIDEEWAELVEDFQETMTEQANRLQTALTPKTKDLEFFPTPEKLWKALGEEDRYAVNHTLIVQFDDDPIDQGSKLAALLAETSSVRFARLRGNHLTPVSATTTLEDDDKKIVRSSPRSKGSINSLIEQTFKGTTKNKRDKIALRNLRMSLVSYITDVVIK